LTVQKIIILRYFLLGSLILLLSTANILLSKAHPQDDSNLIKDYRSAEKYLQNGLKSFQKGNLEKAKKQCLECLEAVSVASSTSVLPPETQVMPGHGLSTTIDNESQNNSYLNKALAFEMLRRTLEDHEKVENLERCSSDSDPYDVKILLTSSQDIESFQKTYGTRLRLKSPLQSFPAIIILSPQVRMAVLSIPDFLQILPILSEIK
jgi:hypothetical protein